MSLNPRSIPRTKALRRLVVALLLAISALGVVEAPQVTHATGAEGFTFLQPGFTETLIGVHSGFLGGVAFAPNGDPLSDGCPFSGGPLFRFAQGSTFAQNGSTLHTESVEASAAGCGLANNPNGALYSNTDSGVVELDANTGALLAGPFGLGGDALGITTDPQTGNLVYVESDGTLGFVDPGLTTNPNFSTALTGDFVDGIAFDPTGTFLFTSTRAGCECLSVIRRDGTLVQNVPVTNQEPDGISFHATSPKFVVTNNTDGTMTRWDFPGDDYTQTPTQTLFASGGFRGDLTGVGPDGCIYLTQDGTRFADGTTSDQQDSLVQVCGGFAPAPGVKDTTPPTCTLKGVIPGGIVIATQDSDGGLAATGGGTFTTAPSPAGGIQLTDVGNASVTIPPVAAGTTGEVDVTALKITAGVSSHVSLTVTDAAGNVTLCDPVSTDVIRDAGRPDVTTATNIAHSEHLLHIYNGNPGLSHLTISVNGTKINETDLAANAQRTVDIGAALQTGNNNTVTVIAHGKQGGTATYVIADS